jgi:hypothetical protein
VNEIKNKSPSHSPYYSTNPLDLFGYSSVLPHVFQQIYHAFPWWMIDLSMFQELKQQFALFDQLLNPFFFQKLYLIFTLGHRLLFFVISRSIFCRRFGCRYVIGYAHFGIYINPGFLLLKYILLIAYL